MKRIVLIFTGLLMTSIIAKGQLPEKVEKNVEYTTASGLKIMFTELNSKNEMPAIGDKVKVHYTGKLTNDTVFDSSVKRGTPFSFDLGKGNVIKGWDEGIAYLHKGDKAVLTIPAALGYGEREMGTIPANSTLIFTVELVDFTAGQKPYDTKGKDTIKTASGLAYIIVSNGKGEKVEAGMNITMHYTGFLEDGKMFDSSVDRGEAITVPVGKGKLIKGWDEGLTYLHVGDKARLLVPSTLAFGEVARGPIPANADLVFDIEVFKAEKSKTAVAYDVAGKDTVTTASGLKYIVVKEGTGAAATAGIRVKVNYTGYLTNGTIFDSSIENGEPFLFNLGKGEVIKGWDEGIALMKTGGQCRLIVPSSLAYGENDYGPIPGKSTLIFDVELLEVNCAK